MSGHLTDHERWVELVAAEARGEELTDAELRFVAAWTEAEDEDEIEGSMWQAIARLGDESLPGERNDDVLLASALSAAIDLEAETCVAPTHDRPTRPRHQPPTASSKTAMSAGSATPARRPPAPPPHAATRQFFAGFAGVVALGGLALVGLAQTGSRREPDLLTRVGRIGSGLGAASMSRDGRAPATSATVAPLAVDAAAPDPSRADPDAAVAQLGCVRLGGGAEACPSSDDAQLEVGAPLGDRLALSLSAGSLKVSAAVPGQPAPRGSLIDTPVATLDADGNASFEARLAADPVVLILVVDHGEVEVTRTDGETVVVRAGDTEVFESSRADVRARARSRAETPSADAMLGRAQTLLVEGEEQAAIRVYRSLLAAHRGTPEARAATLTLARLELERGHPKRALQLFERYLDAPGGDRGALGETAMVGKIEAFRRLGRLEDERAAIDAFLGAHGKSVYAANLRDRKRTLEAQSRE